MKKFLAGLLIFLLAAAGAGYLLYPAVSAQLGQRRDAGVMKAYRWKAAAMDEERKTEMFAEAKAYNDTLGDFRTEDVFTAGTPRTTRDYQNRLNVHSGVIGELVIPKIGAALPVYHLSSETPATRKLVHLDGSSLPADSPGEHIVLAGPGVLKAEGFLGDIGLTDDRMLEDLDRLTPGDLMILNVLDRSMVYRVEGVQTLSAAGLGELDLKPGEAEDRLTLISRHLDRRLLVQSERIRTREARAILEEEDSVSFPDNWLNVLFLGCPVMLAGLVILWVIERFKKRAYRLPDEGRQTGRREQKAREKLEAITTESNEGEEK